MHSHIVGDCTLVLRDQKHSDVHFGSVDEKSALLMLRWSCLGIISVLLLFFTLGRLVKLKKC